MNEEEKSSSTSESTNISKNCSDSDLVADPRKSIKISNSKPAGRASVVSNFGSNSAKASTVKK